MQLQERIIRQGRYGQSPPNSQQPAHALTNPSRSASPRRPFARKVRVILAPDSVQPHLFDLDRVPDPALQEPSTARERPIRRPAPAQEPPLRLCGGGGVQLPLDHVPGEPAVWASCAREDDELTLFCWRVRSTRRSAMSQSVRAPQSPSPSPLLDAVLTLALIPRSTRLNRWLSAPR